MKGGENMRFPKEPPKELLVRIVYTDGTEEIVTSPFKNVDKTKFYFRQVGFYNEKKIETIFKYNFD